MINAEREQEKEKPPAPRVSWLEQWNNVLQLSKDRANGIPGLSNSIKDWEEMGAIDGGHAPFNAESLKRNFGVPIDGSDPDSEWEEHIRASSHRRLEEEILHLRDIAPELYRAYQGCFSPDLSADRDYDFLLSQARKFEAAERELELAQAWRNLPQGHPNHLSHDDAMSLLERTKYLAGQSRLASQVEAALGLLTQRLWRDNLIVEFARMRTMREETEMSSRNTNVYNLFRKVTEPPPDGYGNSVKDAYRTIRQEYGLSERRAQEIVASKTEQLTGEKRKRGRPRKK